MAFVVSENMQLDGEGKAQRSVIVGGHVWTRFDMDELIGALMKVRNQLGDPPPGLDNDAVKQAIGVIQDELGKMGLMKIAKEAHEARQTKPEQPPSKSTTTGR